ncbi:Syntaxin-31 protein [Spatholobus suberectus]|nr:Syntaxin-31 protein [Spatholobus suberectus]
MASSYRDRTSEFRLLSEALKKIGGGGAPPVQPENAPSTSHESYSRSEFNRKASRIGLGIHETSLKIARLAQLAKKSSMFNDPAVEIQELTALIKNEITALNSALSDLQTIQNMDMADGTYSQDRIVHSTAVCDDLKSKLMGATKHLQDVLTARTENIKAHENRKQIFSKNVSRENPFQHQPKPANEPPPWSNSLNASESLQQASVLLSNGAPVGNQLRRRLAGDNTPSHQMELSMVQQVVPRHENYAQSRATALHNVESTITELSGIFSHLATMVAHQGELAIRIDDNMDESLANVEGAHSSLLRHLNQISSNRWLLIKIFAILILFLMIFIFFVA